jgi:hypothetical protein
LYVKNAKKINTHDSNANHKEIIKNHGTVLDELLKKVDVSISVQNKNIRTGVNPGP